MALLNRLLHNVGQANVYFFCIKRYSSFSVLKVQSLCDKGEKKYTQISRGYMKEILRRLHLWQTLQIRKKNTYSWQIL